MNEFPFSKYHGTGNDFVLIDDREEVFPIVPKQVVQLCHRKYGIGADGLILLRPSQKGDFMMRIFNRDGTEAEMCGNGLRCLVQFIHDLGIDADNVHIETMHSLYACEKKGDDILVDMGIPKIVNETEEELFLEVGVPHFVTFVDDLNRFDVEAKRKFSDFGVNINYVNLVGSAVLRVRTFERGVEEETLSCGSGATASVFAAWKKYGIQGRLTVVFGSGETLRFEVTAKERRLLKMTMIGEAKHVFDGRIRVKMEKRLLEGCEVSI
ncbi:MAG: diaminopimelate epimerase [Chlamydiia bacterium]|nr:diaminopimelate epimerase [Chlamydiia bacterium]